MQPRLLDGECHGGGICDGGDAVAGLSGDDDGVSSSRGGGIDGRTVVEIIVTGIAGSCPHHGDQCQQGEERKPLQPWATTGSPGQSSKAERAGKKNCPG